MNTEQAKTLEEVQQRLNDMNEDTDPLDAHLEAENLLLDALVILKQRDIVLAFMSAKQRAKFDY